MTTEKLGENKPMNTPEPISKDTKSNNEYIEWVDSPTFIRELTDLINRYSLEGASNTPDFILSQYIWECLGAFNRATAIRNEWYQGGHDATKPIRH